jgi:hypothetical protein
MYPDLFPRPMNSTAWSEDRASSATQSAEGSTFFYGWTKDQGGQGIAIKKTIYIYMPYIYTYIYMYSYKLLNTQRSGIDMRTELLVGCVELHNVYWSQCYLCGDWMQSISMAGARLLLLNLQSPQFLWPQRNGCASSFKLQTLQFKWCTVPFNKDDACWDVWFLACPLHRSFW